MRAAAQAGEKHNRGMSLSRRFPARAVTRPVLRPFSTTRRGQDARPAPPLFRSRPAEPEGKRAVFNPLLPLVPSGTHLHPGFRQVEAQGQLLSAGRALS